MINLYGEANRKVVCPSGIWTRTFGITERANSTNLSELRFVVNNLTLDISIGEDSTVFRLDLKHPQGNM